MLGCSIGLGEPRDGRFLKKEMKPKHVQQLDRFLGRKTGFANSEICDNDPKDLGLSEFVPSHKHRHAQCQMAQMHKMPRRLFIGFLFHSPGRLSSDFSYRYFRKAAAVLHEASWKAMRSPRLLEAFQRLAADSKSLKPSLSLEQEMAKLPVKGMAFLCDASPKGRMDAAGLISAF